MFGSVGLLRQGWRRYPYPFATVNLNDNHLTLNRSCAFIMPGEFKYPEVSYDDETMDFLRK